MTSVIRSPDVVGVSLMFWPVYISFLLFLLSAALAAHSVELNQTLPCVRKWARFQNLGHRLKIGPTSLHIFCIFHWLRNWMPPSTANIFGMKFETDSRKRALETTKGLRHFPKLSWTSISKCRKIELEFTAAHSIPLDCQALYMVWPCQQH